MLSIREWSTGYKETLLCVSPVMLKIIKIQSVCIFNYFLILMGLGPHLTVLRASGFILRDYSQQRPRYCMQCWRLNWACGHVRGKHLYPDTISLAQLCGVWFDLVWVWGATPVMLGAYSWKCSGN